MYPSLDQDAAGEALGYWVGESRAGSGRLGGGREAFLRLRGRGTCGPTAGEDRELTRGPSTGGKGWLELLCECVEIKRVRLCRPRRAGVRQGRVRIEKH